MRVDPQYFRPTEVDLLIGDPKKAKEKMGWECKIKFKELVADMIHHDQLLLDSGDLTH